MKYIYKISGKISLLCYVFVLYQMWHLCQYGGVRSHFPLLSGGILGLLLSFMLWLISRGLKRKEAAQQNSIDKKIFKIEMIVFIIGTVYFVGRIVYSAIPYHGALSWEMDEWMRKKSVKLEHNNFFQDGVEGVLMDLDEELDLPEELYIANKYQMTFDKDGRIREIYTFLYGKDEKGETRSYLVSYDADQSENMTVWVDGNVNDGYEEDMRLEPMLRILQEAEYVRRVNVWSGSRESAIYEILYFGRRSFDTKEGLEYLPGDVDGDGVESGVNNFLLTGYEGRYTGFEVSLHIPAEDAVAPVRYMMEPEYTSPEELSKEQEMQQIEDAKETESWTLDRNDGTMYFFLNDKQGWRLVVADAALGSRFYEMEKTLDGGVSWEMANTNPFNDQFGVTEGLIFFDENFGVAGLTGASWSASQLFVTRDGGTTFEKLQLPMDEVTELPPLAKECKFTVEDYDYLYMPEKEEGSLIIKVGTEVGESNGILFRSQDNGVTWEFGGIFKE